MFGIQGKNIVDDEDDGMNFTLERMSEVARNFMLFENRIGTQKQKILRKAWQQFFPFFLRLIPPSCASLFSYASN